jgi:putative two-component system response regulator
MSCFYLFIVLLIWNGDSQGAGFIVIYIYPLLAIILLGMKLGVIFSLILFISVCIEVFIPAMSKFTYHIDVSSRLAVIYILVLLMTIVFEKTRNTKDRILEKQRQELIQFNNNLQSMVDAKTKRVVELQNAILKTVADMVEYRDNTTGDHIGRTQQLVNVLISSLQEKQIYSKEMENWNFDVLVLSTLLHDVGKIAISDQILKKPGPLTKEEFDEMKKHSSFGVEVIEKIEAEDMESDFLKHAEIFAGTHHEKWDGSGYPLGLKGEKIPLQGRIMAVADVYDALTSARPYKKAFTHEEAIQIIREGRGTHFDPILVDVFLAISDRFKS